MTSPTTLEEPNALAHGLAILGDEWGMLIVQRALLGDRRYGQFRSSLSISDAMLSARLGELVDIGLLRHAPGGTTTRPGAYLLDGMGRGLWPVHLLIWDWEQAWSPVHAEVLPTMRHRLCGALFRPLLTCGSCGATVPAAAIAAAWGPEGGWPRSIPRGGRRRRAAGPGRFPATMGVVGNHWSLAVVVAALWGARRYGDFRTSLGMSPAVLSERLRTLVAEGFLVEQPSSARRDWVEYHPSARTIALLPVFAVMVAWAERWFGEPQRPSVVLSHRACGEPLRPRLRCDRCVDVLTSDDIHIESRAPSAPGERHGIL